MKRFTFEGLDCPVGFLDGAEQLLDALGLLVQGWNFHETPDCRREPVVTVRREGDCHVIDAPWLEEPVRETCALRAAGNLAVDLMEAYLADHPDLLCLHCGAAEFAGRLVIFPGRSRAGKSTLMARLAAGGIPVYADDVLPIRGAADDRGWSFGIAPRLRLPLPESAGTRFRAFVDRYASLRDEAYAYLQLPADVRPVFGRTAEPGAVVLLDRIPSGSATLSPARKGDGLQELIEQNLAGGIALPHLVGRMHALIERLPCFRLRYADLEDAFERLDSSFRDRTALATDATATAAAAPETSTPTPPSSPTVPAGLRYRRNPDMALHRIDDDLFIVSPDAGTVYRLNTIATGLWHLLSEPVSAAEAIDVMQGAFPELDRSRIAADVHRLFSELAASGLIQAEAVAPV